MEISQAEKEKFIADLSEDQFREKIVRRLFRALGFQDGRDTCGPEEFGKDAIFVEKDKFGVENFTAVQTKKGNINLAGDPNSNLHTIVTQLRTALTQQHVCTKTKRKVLPLIVYLVASGKINQAARNYIAEQLQDPRIRFLDRDDLIAQVDETCSEIWSNITADISPYLKALSQKVEDLSISIDINPVSSSVVAYAAASDHRFVDLQLGYPVSKAVKRHGKIVETFEYEEISGVELLTGAAVRALLLGDAGAGKTTLLIRLAYLLAKKSIVSTKNYKIPVFVRAHELVGQLGHSISVLASIVLKMADVNSVPFTTDDFDEGRIVVLIDGLDELTKIDDRQSVLNFAVQFAEEYRHCSVAIATRPYSSIVHLKGVEKFKRFRISPLDMEGAAKMLNGLTRKEHERGAEWRSEILRRLDGVHGIELNPLLVTVFAITSGADKRDLPANITELFSKFTELMLGRWDEKKGLSQQYQAKVKEHLLAAFAFQLHLDGRTRFAKSEFVNFARQQLEEMNLGADLEIITSEIVDRSGLVRGDDELEFKHHLIQEYFAAKGVPDVGFIKGVVNSEWWRNTIVFYFGGKPDSVSELLDVATESGTKASDSFITIGLALQACYLSKLDERFVVWKWVIDSAAAVTRNELKNGDAKYPIAEFVAQYLQVRDSVALSGVERPDMRVNSWIASGDVPEQSELRRFWYAAALVELGEFGKLNVLLDEKVFENNILNLAIHFGCFLSCNVRAISRKAKQDAGRSCEILEPRIGQLRARVAAEFNGQLLEYRKGGVVALDEVEKKKVSAVQIGTDKVDSR